MFATTRVRIGMISNIGSMYVRGFRASTALQGRVEFKLADIGEGIAEVEVLQWYVKPGDKVNQFDKICEVQSDKATVEITSRYDGVVEKLHWKVGDLAKIGSTLIDLEVEGAGNDRKKGASAPEESPATPEPAEKPQSIKPKVPVNIQPSPSIKRLGSFSVDPVLTPPGGDLGDSGASNAVKLAPGDRILTTPSVRRLAKDHGLDLAHVAEKTGNGARVTKSDVLSYLATVSVEDRQRHAAALAAAEKEASVPPTPVETSSSSATPSASSEPYNAALNRLTALESDKVVPVSGIQRAMVKSMMESLRIPHFQYKDEIKMNNAAEFREYLRGEAQKQGIEKLTYLPIMIKACSLALLHYPQLNAHINSEATEVTYKKDHNISLAMDTPRGLLVPVIKNCQERSIFDIAHELRRLQQLGSENKLGTSELTGATITLSNIGSIGGTYASPVIPAPILVIGAIGKIRTLPRYIDEAHPEQGLYPAKVLSISWAADHRVVDGATMARFSNQMKSYVVNPLTMVSVMK